MINQAHENAIYKAMMDRREFSIVYHFVPTKYGITRLKAFYPINYDYRVAQMRWYREMGVLSNTPTINS